jgi:DNA-binding NarL/FixJ family response regulator
MTAYQIDRKVFMSLRGLVVVVQGASTQSVRWEVCGQARDGLEAVAAGGDLRPDLVLMDLRMPRSDGFDATVRLRRLQPSLPILICSAFGTEENRVRQRDILDLTFRGYPAKQAADRLRVSVRTVEFHRAALRARFRVHSTAELLRIVGEQRVGHGPRSALE